MKKTTLCLIMALSVFASLTALAGCSAATSTTAGSSTPETTTEIEYANASFDYGDQIAAELKAGTTVPEAAALPFTVSDGRGATGVMAVASHTGNGEYYMNALVAGSTLTLSAADGAAITNIASTAGNDTIRISADGKTASLVPSRLVIDDNGSVSDEVLTVTMADGAEYRLHTQNDLMPCMAVTGTGVSGENAGVYTFVIDHFLLRVNTEREIVYFRDMSCCGDNLVENFCSQDNGTFSYYKELHKPYRQPYGGYGSGVYYLMDENYVEDAEPVTLAANADSGRVHGEGYLDQHEFVVIEQGHYLVLSYTAELVSNLPQTVTGIDGSSSAYVWAGIFQEVKDGQVVREISTTDYPLLYESAVENIDYAGSKAVDESVDADADVTRDYVHVNSLDYQLNDDGTVSKLLVSMRNQCAVYQFDMASGEIDWILGGKATTLTGYEEYATTREDQNGVQFTALTYGQHCARYVDRANPSVISLFDNGTDPAGYPYVDNETRTLKVSIDEGSKTATASDIVDASSLDVLSEKLHTASHCGSVKYASDTSVVIGWGLYEGADTGALAKMGNPAWEDLVPGCVPVFTEYDPAHNAISMELTVTRNPNRTALQESGGIAVEEAMFSYRTYKTER